MQAFEHQECYLTAVLHFVGITDIHFIRAEGLNLGADSRNQSLLMAHQYIKELFKQNNQVAV